MERAKALDELAACLEGVDFPVHLDELLEQTKEAPCFRAPNGDDWSLRDLLTGVPVTEFSSARHVQEVVRLRWEDMADVFRPGGFGPGRPYGPTDKRSMEGETTENAVRAHDEATGGKRDPRAGP